MDPKNIQSNFFSATCVFFWVGNFDVRFFLGSKILGLFIFLGLQYEALSDPPSRKLRVPPLGAIYLIKLCFSSFKEKNRACNLIILLFLGVHVLNFPYILNIGQNVTHVVSFIISRANQGYCNLLHSISVRLPNATSWNVVSHNDITYFIVCTTMILFMQRLVTGHVK